MAKFCTKCGKKLEDGQKCDCDKKEVKEVTEERVVVASQAGNDMVNDYISVLKGIFVSPIDTMKNFAKRSKFTLGLIMMVINSLVFGLFVFLFAKEGITGLMTAMYGKTLGSLAGSADVEVKVLFIAALLMMAFFLCLGGLLHLISGPIMKKESDIKRTYALIGASSVLTTVTTLIAIVCVYINFWLMLIVLLVSGVLYMLTTYHGFTELTKVDKNKMAYVFTIAYGITLFVVVYLLPKIFS